MAERELILNDVLCFLLTKFSKISVNLIKRIAVDFFVVDALSEAKRQLIDDVVLLDIPESLPKVTGRHIGDDRAVRETDDILKLILFLDERKQLERLPRYVTDNTDRLPTVNLSEGDLKFFLDKLDGSNAKMDSLNGTMNTVVADILGLKTSYSSLHAAIHQLFRQSGDVNISGSSNVVSRPPATAVSQLQSASIQAIHSGNSTTVHTKVNNLDNGHITGAGVRWSSVTSTPVRNRYETLDSATDADDETAHNDNADEGGPWSLVISDRARKTKQRSLKRPSESPLYSNIVRTGAGTEQGQQQQSLQCRRGPLLVGKSSASKLVAAKKLYKRAVFYVDNLSPSTTVDDLIAFVQQNVGVDVLTCFEVVPRRRAGEDEDATARKATRHAFRLCIKESDIEHLLIPSCWPDSVSISAWTFRGRQEGEKRIRLDEETAVKKLDVNLPSESAAQGNLEDMEEPDETVLMNKTAIAASLN